MSILNALQAGQFRLDDPKMRGLLQASKGKTPAQEDSAKVLSGLQNKILESLANKIPGMTPEKMRALDAREYTPEKVSDRIADFVSRGLDNARARGASESDIAELQRQATEGARRGFAEAREILDSLDILSGRIAEDVERTEELTFDKLAALGSVTSPAASELTSMAAAERYAQAERFEMNITTRSGQEVTIAFDRSMTQESSGAVAVDDQGNRVARFDISRSEQSGFQFSIRGDLEADELEAIENLVRDVSQLANEFFNGDVQQAFEQARNLDFDASQLARMDLSMSRTEVYIATQAYTQTSHLDEHGDSQRGVRRIDQLVDGLAQKIQDRQLAFIDQQADFVSQLMERLTEQDTRFKRADSDTQQDMRDHLGMLISAARERAARTADD
ncbi:MAG: DUF5610 domain-containing protein [Halothiobacillaceae bacterium]